MEPISLNVLNDTLPDPALVADAVEPADLLRADEIIYDFVTSDLPLHALAKRYQLSLDELIVWSEAPGTLHRINKLRELGTRRAEAAAANARATAILVLEEILTTRDGSSDTLRRAATTLLKAGAPPRATPTPPPVALSSPTPHAPHTPRPRTIRRNRRRTSLTSASALLASVGTPQAPAARHPQSPQVSQECSSPFHASEGRQRCTSEACSVQTACKNVSIPDQNDVIEIALAPGSHRARDPTVEEAGTE